MLFPYPAPLLSNPTSNAHANQKLQKPPYETLRRFRHVRLVQMNEHFEDKHKQDDDTTPRNALLKNTKKIKNKKTFL